MPIKIKWPTQENGYTGRSPVEQAALSNEERLMLVKVAYRLKQVRRGTANLNKTELGWPANAPEAHALIEESRQVRVELEKLEKKLAKCYAKETE